jgi:hypothetical protein
VRALYTAVSPNKRDSSIRTAEEYAGYAVCDPRGQRLGRTETIFLNGRGEPEYSFLPPFSTWCRSFQVPMSDLAAGGLQDRGAMHVL